MKPFAFLWLVAGVLAGCALPVSTSQHSSERTESCGSESKRPRTNCYPYRRGPRGCLTRCQTARDCVQGGWPLACQRNHCVPFQRAPDGTPYE